MDKSLPRVLKANSTIADANLRAVRALLRMPGDLNTSQVRCHVLHLQESAASMLALLDQTPEQEPMTLNLDPVTVNGTN